MVAWRHSDVLLALGRYAEGWQLQGRRFELERRMPGVGPAGRRFLRPMWEPGNSPQRVHVHAEQGYGDVIMMARYLPLLVEMGHDVRFEVKRDMVSLFRDSLGSDIKVVPLAADYPGAFGIDDFDTHIPSMTLPTLFKTSINTIPWRGPYIRSSRYPLFRMGLKIGLCWTSGSQPGLWHREYSKRKSIPFWPDVWRIIDETAATFYALQLHDVPSRLPRKLLAPLGSLSSPTWADTAALVDACDLVVTVDTGVAHLAGAMGKRTILMLHGPGVSWHWMADRDGARWQHRSPWYPTVEIVRQQKPHQWVGVIETVLGMIK
jgi:hypothetical protein